METNTSGELDDQTKENIAEALEQKEAARTNIVRVIESQPDLSPDAMVALPTAPKAPKLMKIEELDFDPKYNIRDVGIYADRVQQKVQVLLQDGVIRTPLIACVMKDVPGSLPRGACGFLRYHALKWIQEHKPDFYKDHFAKIPVYIYENCTERDRENLMYDHGIEEGLNEYEVLLAQARLLRVGRKEKPIAQIMHPMFMALLSEKSRAENRALISEFNQNGYVLTNKGTTRYNTLEDLLLNWHRGRIQYYSRLIKANAVCPMVLDEFRKSCLGDKSAVRVSRETAVAMVKEGEAWTKEQIEQWFEAEKKQTGGGTRKESLVWGKSDLKRIKDANASKILGAQLDAALGDESARASLPDLEAQMLRIESAMSKNPEAFWKAVDAINAE